MTRTYSLGIVLGVSLITGSVGAAQNAPGAVAERLCASVRGKLEAVAGTEGFAHSSGQVIFPLSGERGFRLAQKPLDSEVTQKLRAAFDAIPEFKGSHPDFQLVRADDLFAFWQAAGTDYCMSYAFFEMKDGEPRAVPNPPKMKWPICGDAVELAKIDGATALVINSGLGQNERIGIVPWVNGHWDTSCRMEMTFATKFVVEKAFCSGVDCEALKPLALSVVGQRVGGEEKPRAPGTPLDAENSPDYQSLREMLNGGDSWSGQLPTFGGNAYTEFTGFSPDAVFFPVVLDRQIYLARLSRASRGFRELPDYLMGLYTMPGSGRPVDEYGLSPVAGLYIALKRGAITNVTTRILR